jgi:SAM-dependent methyltransferase
VKRIHAFDHNEAMLEYARRRLPDAHLFRADMEDFQREIPAGSIDLAVNTINTIRHIGSDAGLQRHLEGIHRCLAPGGLYLVGLSLSDYDHDEPSEDHWIARRGRLTVRQLIQYIPPPGSRGRERIEEIYAHVRIERPRGSETRDHRYGLRAYDAAQWQRQIARSPLVSRGCYDDRGNELYEPAPEYSIYALAKGQPDR